MWGFSYFLLIPYFLLILSTSAIQGSKDVQRNTNRLRGQKLMGVTYSFPYCSSLCDRTEWTSQGEKKTQGIKMKRGMDKIRSRIPAKRVVLVMLAV